MDRYKITVEIEKQQVKSFVTIQADGFYNVLIDFSDDVYDIADLVVFKPMKASIEITVDNDGDVDEKIGEIIKRFTEKILLVKEEKEGEIYGR